MEQKEIEKVISEYFSIDIKDIYSKSRKKKCYIGKTSFNLYIAR
jgi:chromosomal replication initiation ATPase DnaA